MGSYKQSLTTPGGVDRISIGKVLSQHCRARIHSIPAVVRHIFLACPVKENADIKIDVGERAELTEERLGRTIREETEMKEVEIEASTKEEQIVRLEVDMCS